LVLGPFKRKGIGGRGKKKITGENDGAPGRLRKEKSDLTKGYFPNEFQKKEGPWWFSKKKGETGLDPF